MRTIRSCGMSAQHARLGAQDDQAVVGDVEAAGTQAVAVEHRADDGAVGEGDRRGAVPGLHQRGVELVEGPAGRVHLRVVLPRLRDHHQDGVRQRPAAEVEQLQRLVEGGGVGAVGVADREQPLQVTGDQVGVEHRLAGAHPVAVALDGVDLTVVGDVAVGVRQRPRREGVGGEARVHQRDGRHVALVRQVGEERLDLLRGQHALVDGGPAGERGEVDVGLVLGPLAEREGGPVELDARQVAGAHEELGEVGHHGPGGGPGVPRVDGHVAPAEHGDVLLGRDLVDHPQGDRPGLRVDRQEGDAGGVLPGLGQGEGNHRAEERVGDLRQDAGAVTGVRFAPPSTPVVEVDERGQSLFDDVVTAAAVDVGHHGDTTGVMLVRGVVKALRLGKVPRTAMAGSRHEITPVVFFCVVTEGRRWPCCSCK